MTDELLAIAEELGIDLDNVQLEPDTDGGLGGGLAASPPDVEPEARPKTTYYVFEDTGTEDDLMHWSLLGTIEAYNADKARRDFIDPPRTGCFVAVAASAFKPHTLAVKTTASWTPVGEED